jgi:ubiquinone/menaquinone biosynthesis C-methylase UbiE
MGAAMDRLDLRPPEDSIFIGGGNFQQIGNEFFGYLVNLAGLQPNHRVLDVGCGIGRIALPLTAFLKEPGNYEGIDIVPQGIDWCQENITAWFPHFRFQRADLFNRSYNPCGRREACDFVFPFPDNSFDLVFVTSVFTHMLPADVENYLYEIARVLKNGGKCLLTYFLWNQESSELIAAGKSQLPFQAPRGVYRTVSRHRPEDAVCYDEAFIMKLQEKYGFEVVAPIHYGSWCGRPRFLSHQDIVVATKIRSHAKPKPELSTITRLGFALRRNFHGRVMASLRRIAWRSAATQIQRHVNARKQPREKTPNRP